MGGVGCETARAFARSVALASCLTGCAVMPSEFNLSPVYRHRFARDGSLLELDFLWPIFHWRRLDDGGTDFRVRPLYRNIANGLPKPGYRQAAVEHQFLWPFGRFYDNGVETLGRLWPLWRYKVRRFEDGGSDLNWNVALLLWGGVEMGEHYFGFFPFYLNIPDFLTYTRFKTVLFPLYVGLEKRDVKNDIFLWPLVAFGRNAEGTVWNWRILPLFGMTAKHRGNAHYERYSALWPFFSWGYEHLETDNPTWRFFFFPLFGRMVSETVDGWTILWPFFQMYSIENRLLRLDILWPIFRYFRDDAESQRVFSWWFWPLYGYAETPYQRTWSILWPLIRLREYYDPEGTLYQDFVFPFYWWTHRDHRDGREDAFLKIWPLYHVQTRANGSGEWQTLSPWPWRQGNAYGVDELYGWLWTLAKGSYTARGDRFDLAAHLFTTEKRNGRRQSSVPLLFNYTEDETGSMLRLFQFLPIRLSGPTGDTGEDRSW